MKTTREQNDGAPKRPMNIPTVYDLTGSQLANVLACLNVLAPYQIRGLDHEEATVGGKNDGGVKMALDNATIATLDRLEAILRDDKRWGTERLDELSELLEHALKEETAAASQRITFFKEAGAPHVTLRPRLLQDPRTGVWLCLMGGDETGAGSLYGRGLTPEEACLEFDRKYYDKRDQTQEMDGRGEGNSQELPVDEGGSDASAAVTPKPGERGKEMGEAPAKPRRRRPRRSTGSSGSEAG